MGARARAACKAPQNHVALAVKGVPAIERVDDCDCLMASPAANCGRPSERQKNKQMFDPARSLPDTPMTGLPGTITAKAPRWQRV
jgi:hypothetical protein